MPSGNSKISEFIERAKANGASDQSLVGILAAHGWPEREVYRTLGAYYENLTGAEVPRRGEGGTPAKDAFFYLVLFSTLATWTIGLGSLSFTLIDRWLADTLFSQGYVQGYETYTIASAVASILVAFPIYLVVSRAVVRDARSQPEKLNSPVRKWLTYMALVIAAGVFIGDLITALSYFLQGEVTSRFLAKVVVVLIISGGVFFYYFGGLRRTHESDERPRWNRDSRMAAISAAVVTVMVILGFSSNGAPQTQRNLRADERRVQDLYRVSVQVRGRWSSGGSEHKLPTSIGELSGSPAADPITRTPYEYRLTGANQYELCATFALPSGQTNDDARSVWSHPSGRHCFSIDVTATPESPGVYFPQ